MTKEQFFKAFGPDMIDEYVSKGLGRMYTGTAPTVNDCASLWGEAAALDWETALFAHAVAFSSPGCPMSPQSMRSLVRKAKAVYGWMKATELMHFCHLFCSGRYGKFYGEPDAQTVMTALGQYALRDHPEYCAQAMAQQERERAQGERQSPKARVSAPPRIAGEDFEPDEGRGGCNGVAASVLEALEGAQGARWGEWRKEPWGTAMARAFFVDKSLGQFPGDMPYAERRRWGVSHGCTERQAADWDARRRASEQKTI